MTNITLAASKKITTILHGAFPQEAIRTHFVPLLAAHGGEVMNAEAVAQLLYFSFCEARPILRDDGVEFHRADLEVVIAALTHTGDLLFGTRLHQVLDELFTLHVASHAPPDEKS